MNVHFLYSWIFTKKESDTFIASPLQTLKGSKAVVIKPTKHKHIPQENTASRMVGLYSVIHNVALKDNLNF